ncbi:sel1 repeat family protein, partial [Alphaproteobacteria bacterium]|nr:sel1 repeat family protein [Alphaproteobacteria bacterium]
YNLGVMYKNGEGVPQNYKAAVKWYRLAAEQGDAKAQFVLGAIYFLGQGVPRDDVYAHMWWNIAAATGNEDAVKSRDIITKMMSPADISKAQKLARECVAKDYKNC